MKTRMKLHLIIYTAFIAALSSCENEIPYTPGQKEPQLILNALLDAGQAENYAYLHLSEGNSIGKVSQGTLSLYVNGQLAESPEAMLPKEIYDDVNAFWDKDAYESALENIDFKKFRLTTALHPGDRLRLEATAENGKYRVSSEVTVPQPVEAVQVDTCSAYVREYSGRTLYRQYKITFPDRPDEKNYYRLEIWNDLRFRCEWLEYRTDENGDFIKVEDENGWHWDTVKRDTVINSRQTGMVTREDVILTDGHPVSSDDKENGMFPTIENKYNIFTDNRFANSSATLKVYTPHYNDLFPFEGRYHQIYRTHTITVRVLSISEAQYRYLRALNTLEDDEYDEELMDPISLLTNVEGGLGFVGVCAEAKAVLVLPETPIYGSW